MDADVAAIEHWLQNLPSSEIIHPTDFGNWPKYIFWRIYTPLHPFIRNTAQRFGLNSAYFVKQERDGRQNFLIGTIAPGETVESVVKHLVERGFRNHFVAWRDDGEMVSLRLMENFVYQYHLRIFEDGEIRGHYEYTPECYPLRHLKGIGQEDCRHIFHEHLKEKIVRA